MPLINNKSPSTWGPWKPIRFALRLIFFVVLAWLTIALLWSFIPSPLSDRSPDNGTLYPTEQLRAGKTLTRVYDSDYFRIENNRRAGFAIDYKLDMDDLTLKIGGADNPLPLFKKDEVEGTFREQIQATARIGDQDGANLPWFEFADAILLYWCIQKEDLTFAMDITWTLEKDSDLRKMEVQAAGYPHRRVLLTLEIRGSDTSSIVVETPESPYSFSPSRTYPVRVALIHILAPTAILVNDFLGNAVGQVIQSVLTVIFILLGAVMWVFAVFAFIFSIWGCVGGPSFESVVERTQARLDILRQNERLCYLRIAALQERLDQLCRNERFQSAVDICRNGWHPESRAALAAGREVDVEKEASPKEELD